jgi:hypothetical protein
MFTTYKKRSLITLAVFLVLSAAIAKPPGFSKGLVLWFRTAPSAVKIKDASGRKNTGRPVSVSVVVTNSPSLVSMQDTHQLTLALWIKPNSIPGFFPVLLSKGGNESPSAYGGYELDLNASGDNDIVFVSGGYFADTSEADGSLINNHLGEWIHVAFTIDTVAQTAQFYVNGQSVTNVASGGSITDVNFNVTNDLYIGTPDPAANGNRARFDGEMGQILIYNRTLSAGEIQKIFSTTKPKS